MPNLVTLRPGIKRHYTARSKIWSPINVRALSIYGFHTDPLQNGRVDRR